jgi:hypothetical protein
MRRILIFLLILCSSLAYSQSSPRLAPAYTHCFTDADWAAFEEEIWQEEQASMLEAADEAVKPHLVYEATLKADLAKQERSTKTWRAVGIAGIIATLIASLVAALR